MPKSNRLPDKDELWRLLNYDRKTGRLLWNKRTPEMFAITKGGRSLEHACNQWNSRWAGKEALTKVNIGYHCGRLSYQYVLAHRVIWKMMTGEEAVEIDHIDGNRSNNAWDNLRSVRTSINRRNARLRSDNVSGCPGVFFNTQKGKWQSSIHLASGMIYLGSFDLKENAIAARKAAEKKYGFHPNHGRET
jgi:hypothetical protein